MHQDRLATVGTLASGLAHEIGTPLGTVRGRAELIRAKVTDPKIQSSLDVIVQQIDRVSRIISSLMRVSHRPDEKKSLDGIPLAHVIEEIEPLIEQNIRKHQIVFTKDIPSEVVVLGDRDRLTQVFLNLLINAIHAIEEAKQKGRIQDHHLSVLFKGAKNIDGRKKIITLAVEDSGVGILPQNMDKLFRPFFTTKDVGHGTGLGLTMVLNLLHEMGGSIEVQSVFGKGSTFLVSLEMP